MVKLNTEKLSSACKARGMTVQDCCTASGLSTNQHYKIMQTRQIQDYTLFRLLEILKLEPLDLIEYERGTLTTGQSLELTRLEKRLLTNDVAAQCNVTPTTIKRMELYDSIPPLDLAYSIAKLFGRTIEECFFRVLPTETEVKKDD